VAEDDVRLKAWSALLGAQALVRRRVEGRLKAAGLPSVAWYDVLWELERAGGELRIGELAERLVIEPYNATRLLDRVESEKLLRREKAAEDKRGARAVLTDAGRALRRRMWPVYKRAIEEVFAQPLSKSQAQAMVRGLAKVIASVRRE